MTSTSETRLSAYLEKHGLADDKETLFVTMADERYVLPIMQTVYKLKQTNPKNKVLILCMDAGCVAELERYGQMGYYGSIGENVAKVKFETIGDLLNIGRDFVMFDGDVFVNSADSILSHMLPLSQEWDWQIQRDNMVIDSNINIGWMWIRPTVASKFFWSAAYRRWQDTKIWDQDVVRILLQEVESGGIADHPKLTVPRLSNEAFMNWMWYGSSPSSPAGVQRYDDLIGQASIVHLTCLEHALKRYFAKNYGLWQDFEGYYSKPPALLTVNFDSGDLASLTSQMDLALTLAEATDRILVFPEFLTWQYNASSLAKSSPVHELFHIPTIEHKIVEARYLANREKLHLSPIPSTTAVPDALSLAGYITALAKVPRSSVAHLEYLKTGLADAKKQTKICTLVYRDKWCLGHCGAAKSLEEL